MLHGWTCTHAGQTAVGAHRPTQSSVGVRTRCAASSIGWQAERTKARSHHLTQSSVSSTCRHNSTCSHAEMGSQVVQAHHSGSPPPPAAPPAAKSGGTRRPPPSQSRRKTRAAAAAARGRQVRHGMGKHGTCSELDAVIHMPLHQLKSVALQSTRRPACQAKSNRGATAGMRG